MERTSHCLEKKSVQQCQERVLSGLHIDDDFCFPIAERWCGATEDIRIKTDGTEIPYGVGVKFAADLCAHYKIIPTQAAALEKIELLGVGRRERNADGTYKKNEKKQERQRAKRAERAERKKQRAQQ